MRIIGIIFGLISLAATLAMTAISTSYNSNQMEQAAQLFEDFGYGDDFLDDDYVYEDDASYFFEDESEAEESSVDKPEEKRPLLEPMPDDYLPPGVERL